MLLSIQSENDNNKALTATGTDARNKEIWIMIIQVSLLTDLISIDRLFVRAWIISKKIDEYDMEGNKLPKFEDWEAEKIKDPDFLAAAYK